MPWSAKYSWPSGLNFTAAGMANQVATVTISALSTLILTSLPRFNFAKEIQGDEQTAVMRKGNRIYSWLDKASILASRMANTSQPAVVRIRFVLIDLSFMDTLVENWEMLPIAIRTVLLYTVIAMNCPNCGFSEIPDGSRFCPNCKQALLQPALSGVQNTNISVEQQVAKAEEGSTVTGVNIRQLIGNVFVSAPDRDLARDQRNLRILLEKVRTFWVDGVLRNSLQNALLIDLEKEAMPKAVASPWEQLVSDQEQPSEPVAADKLILTLFEEMGRAMLILGEPGSGKTITLLELAQALVAEAESRPDQPVPVILNLSTWGEQHASMLDWLVEELNEKYQIPRSISRQWIDRDALVYLLDGFDEVAAERRKDCLKAINSFREAHGLAGLVICSRLQEYVEIGERLRLDGSIRLRNLTEGQVDAYLTGLGPQLTSLRELLWNDPELASLAKTPLVLSILCMTYQDTPEIPAPAVEERSDANTRTRLFSAYIRRMFARRPGRALFSQEKMTAWLSWLAFNMKQSSLSQFLIESMQPYWLPSTGWRRFYNLLVALISGLPIGLLLGFGVAYPVLLSASPDIGWYAGFTTLSRLVQVAGYQLWLGILLSTLLTAGFTSIRFYGLLPALICGGGYGLSFGLSFGRVFSQQIGLPLGATIAVLVAGLYFVIGWFVTRRSPTRGDAIVIADKLDWSWSRCALGFLVGAIPGFLFGALLWWAIRGEIFIPNYGLRFALTFGAAAGANVGVLLGFIVRGVDQSVSPNQGIRRSAWNALRVGLAIWLSVGLPLGYLSGLTWRLALGPAKNIYAGLAVFFGVGLALGLLTSTFFGSLAVIQHNVLRLILAYLDRLLLRLVSFLDSAVELIFLQKVGGGYIFIHRLLMDHFADLYRPSSLT